MKDKDSFDIRGHSVGNLLLSFISEHYLEI